MGKGKKRKKPFGSFTSGLDGALPAVGDEGGVDDEDASGDEGGELGSLTTQAVDITTRTLKFLSGRPELFATRPFRDLRAALHPLVQVQLSKYDLVDYGSRASAALRLGKWEEALLALDGCRAFQQVPKQGTVQRWVRDCDTADELTRLRLLDSIVRTSKPNPSAHPHPPSAVEAAAADGGGAGAGAGAGAARDYPG